MLFTDTNIKHAVNAITQKGSTLPYIYLGDLIFYLTIFLDVKHVSFNKKNRRLFFLRFFTKTI